MRVCIFTRSMPAHREGKAMFHHNIIGPGLSRRGHQITIITTGRQDGIESEKEEGISTFYLKGTPPDIYSEQFWKESAKKFDELHEGERFDIVCSESEAGFGWLTYSKYQEVVPLIHIKHNTFSTVRITMPSKMSIRGILNYLTSLKKQKKFYKNVSEKLLIRANAIICVSKMLANAVMQDCPRSKEKIHIVYNGIDMSRFTPDEEKVRNLKTELGITDERLILYIGRLSPEKGIDYLIRALPYISDKYFKLVILGHGNQQYVNKLNTIISDLDIENRIILLQGAPYSEVPAYYGIADIVVLPSLFDFESFGFVILEAFASRKPVIASRVGGVPETVENNVNGYLVPRKNSKILAEKIGALLKDESLMNSMAESGYNLVCEKFTLDKMIQETEKVFYGAISSRKV